MPSLQDLLMEAASRDAYEVVMETGQPVIATTEKGGIPLGAALTEDALFAALTDVLSEEQQVELAVGNVIEFELAASGDWHVLTEPGADGISVRARLATTPNVAAAGPSIDLPPVAPFQGGRVSLPPMSAEDSFSSIPVVAPAPGNVGENAPVTFGSSRPTVSLDGSSPPMASDSFAPAPGPAPAGPPAAAGQSAPSPFDLTFEPPSAARDPSALEDPSGFIPIDDDEQDSISIEQSRNSIDDTLEFAIVPPPTPPPEGPGPDADTRDDIAKAKTPTGENATRMDLVPPPPLRFADTRSDINSVLDSTPPVSGTLAEVVPQLPSTGLCFVHGADADDVAALLGRESILAEEQGDPVELAHHVQSLRPGSIVIIKVEDPSRWLGWALRRLEEGCLILVETQASTSGGAKRCLLGHAATVRAESWLERHTLRSLIATDGIWTLELPR